uniref:Tripartite motif containing 40 n=1 Tax=Nomascus leucogenys TaxID=61853 RepID=G1QYJ6_NOMLE
MIPLQKDNQEEGVCPICQESLKETVSTNCGHLFCRVNMPVLSSVVLCLYLYCCNLCLLFFIYTMPVERLNRRSRKLRKDIAELQRLKAQQEKKLQALQFQVDHENHRLEAGLESQHQTREQLDALPQQWLGQLEHMPAEVARILDISRTVTQLSSLVIDLERTAKELDTNTLKNAGDLLNRSAPQKLEVIYPQLEKGVSELLLQPPSEALTCSSLGHLTSGSPQPPLSPSSNLSRPPLGLPSASSGLPAPEHVTISSCLQLSPDA